MPAGNSVRPNKWSKVTDLYDDGIYSAIWGCYNTRTEKCLGVRWNGNEDQGYPNQGDNPLWYVEPEFLTKYILLELLHKVNNDPSLGVICNILSALKKYPNSV